MAVEVERFVAGIFGPVGLAGDGRGVGVRPTSASSNKAGVGHCPYRVLPSNDVDIWRLEVLVC